MNDSDRHGNETDGEKDMGVARRKLTNRERAQAERQAAAERRAAKERRAFSPKPIGDTRIGKASSIEERRRIISQITGRSGIQSWVEVLSCWADTELRVDVEAALGRIGWRWVHATMNRGEGWSPDLLQLVETEASKLPPAPKPGDGLETKWVGYLDPSYRGDRER